MFSLSLDDVDLGETFWSSQDPSLRHRAAFVSYGDTGARDSAVILAELEPGFAVGRHTDSAEEVVIVLSGALQAEIGDETRRLAAGDLVLVPERMPHNFRNIGDGPARFLGFFAKAQIISTFDVPLMPGGQRVFRTDQMVTDPPIS